VAHKVRAEKRPKAWRRRDLVHESTVAAATGHNRWWREQESAQHTESSIRVYRRSGVTRARLTFADGFVPEFSIHRCDLYFFHDADVLIVVLEISR
jgi:hypothetical protein